MTKTTLRDTLAVLGLWATGLTMTAALTQTPAAGVSESFVNGLEPDLRAPVRACLSFTPAGESGYMKLPVADRRRGLIRAVMKCAEQTPFVIDRLRAEPDETKIWLMREMPLYTHWRNAPAVDAALDSLVESEANAEVVQCALETHRRLDMQRGRDRLDARLARSAGRDEAMATMLRDEQERWVSLERGAMIPTFFRHRDEVWTAKPAGRTMRVVAFGDFGTGADTQIRTAAAIRQEHAKQPFDFGLTVGDNFYSEGLSTPTDPRWTTQWEDVYGPLRIPFYATLGNHDWYHPDSPISEMLRSRDSDTWRMPAAYYTFTAGWAQFFALDTEGWSERQAEWLRTSLEASRARWKIVYGHNPPFVALRTQTNPAYVTELQQWTSRIMPVLAGRADMMLAGHHHSLQHLAPREGVEFFITGGGGATSYPSGAKGPDVRFAESAHGFAVLEIGADTLTVRFVSMDRGELYAHTLHKNQGYSR